MSTASELHSQIASIVEVLANSAVAEICKAVEDGYAVVNLEMSRSVKENECLRRRVRLLELQVSRYRAEQRLKSPGEGAMTSRGFPGVRLLRHGRDTPTGSALQNRPRFLNRSSVSQPQHKTPSTDLDQDPDQEVVTTTKTEPAEPEEDSDLIIVKVEGSVSIEHPNVSNATSAPPTARTSDSQAQTSCQMEVSGSQTFSKTQDRTLPPPHCQQTQKHDKNSSQQFDLIVLDGVEVGKQDTSEKVLPLNQSFQSQCPSAVNQTARTSSAAATSFPTKTLNHPNVNVSNQLFETNQGVAHFPVASNQSLNTILVSPHGSFSRKAPSQDSHALWPFSCSKCLMKFSSEPDLVKHVAGHRRRKFFCEICGKGFVCQSQVEIHQNVHTGDKPFKCVACHSSFSHPSNLRRHMKLQHQLVKN